MKQKIRWLMPAIILCSAAFISWWSARATSAVEQHVRIRVIELLPMIQVSPGDIEKMVIDPILSKQVGTSLTAVSELWSRNKDELTVTVTTGDDPKYGDGSATHVAIVGVGGKAVLGLRLLYGGTKEPMRIAGVWTP